MAPDSEYHDNIVTLLELIWGKGYMAPGGRGNVAKLLEGTEPAGKRILDVGCGIGGPALEMVRTHAAQVVGIDLEAPLVERARRNAREAALHEHCSFRVVEPGPMPFDDKSFDIVVSAGAVTQTADKLSLFGEIRRVLRPGGHFRCYEWTGSGGELSDDMIYWIQLEGLTYEFRTLAEYSELLVEAGFENVETTDATAWYRAEAHRELELMRGDLFGRMQDLLGDEDAKHFIEDWRAMTVVIDAGEMRQAYCRATRPLDKSA